MSNLSMLTLGVIGKVLGLAGSAWAQQPVLTEPTPATTAGGNVSTTIVTTSTFQQVFAAAPTSPSGGPGRFGCFIQNNGTNVMYVSEGIAVASATTAKSIKLAAAGTFSCAIGSAALQGIIVITGTAGDAYYAAQF